MLRKLLQHFSKSSLIFTVILLGSITWSLVMVRSGIKYPFGLGFWGANGHDGIWHIALSESLSRGTLENPVFSGSLLKNYHLGFDLLVALIHKITSIPVTYLYFQVFPIIFSILIGLLVYKFVLNWRASKPEALWSTFFVYFSGSFGFVITYLRDGIFTGESMFWSQQSHSTLVNPPFALSLIFILSGLIALQKKKLLLSIIFFGLLIQIKAYSAILVLGGLFISGVYSYYIASATYYIRVFLGSLLLNLILYLLFKSDSIGSVFIWQPFWFLETMMSYSDRLGWDKFYSAMTTYKMGGIWLKGLLAYSTAFVIFLIGNMGTRVIGFYFFLKVFKNKIKVDSTLVFVISIISMAVIIPMFFVQTATPWNTIQFFYYYLFFLSIFAGIVTSWLNNLVKLLVIVFAVFGSWTTLQHYLPKMPQAIVSNDEIEALEFLRKQPDGIVLTYPFDKYKAIEAESNPPRPLYLYDSTAYVSAISKKQIFIEDEVNLNIMGYDWQKRRLEVEEFFKNQNITFLENNNISYIYLVGYQKQQKLNLEKIFENKASMIFSFRK